MKHHEAIAVAKDLKERVKKHLDKGEALLKLQPSLEQYKEVIQFNAIADDILSTYGGQQVSVSNEDFSTDSIQTRVVSLESLLSKITQFLKRRKAVPQEETKREYPQYETMANRLQWLVSEAPALIAQYQDKEDNIKLTGTTGGFFTGDPKHFVRDVKADLDMYRALVRSVKQGVKPAVNHMLAFEKGLDRFIDDVDRLEEFIAYIGPMIAKEPKPFKETFRKPNHSFLGFGKPNNWFDIDEINGDGFKSSRKEVEVPYPSKKELDDLYQLAIKGVELTMDISTFSDEIPIDLDYSDPPFRGYSGEVEVDKLAAQSTMFEPSFSEQHTGVVHNLSIAVYGLTAALVDYLRKTLS